MGCFFLSTRKRGGKFNRNKAINKYGTIVNPRGFIEEIFVFRSLTDIEIQVLGPGESVSTYEKKSSIIHNSNNGVLDICSIRFFILVAYMNNLFHFITE